MPKKIKRKEAEPRRTATPAALQIIGSKLLYTTESAGAALGTTQRWVVDYLIRNDGTPHRREGDYIGILGATLIGCVKADLLRHSEWRSQEAVGSSGGNLMR